MHKIMLPLFIQHKKTIVAACMVFLIFFAFMMNIQRSIKLEMDVKPSMWSINAIPYALSKLVFDQEKYISNKVVYDAFMHGRNTISNNAGIDYVLNLEKSSIGKDFILWDIEDKGIIDYVSLSFKIFGFKAERILNLFYLILFVSSLAYTAINILYPTRLIILLQFLIMLYLVQPMTSINPQLTSLVAPRALPVLSIIACLHCLFFTFTPSKKVLSILMLALQIGIIIFVTHLRIVTYWQIVAIITVSICVFFIRTLYTLNKGMFYSFRKSALSLLPILLIFVYLFGLHTYRNAVFPKTYEASGHPQTRLVWHNILSGLAFEPMLAAKYNLKIDDGSIVDMVSEYLLIEHRDEELMNLNAGGGDHIYPYMRWDSYDKLAKEVLINTCIDHPVECLKVNVYYKPLSLIKNLGWAYGVRKLPADLDVYVSNFQTNSDAVKVQAIQTSNKLDELRQRAYLWSRSAILLLIIPMFIIIMSTFDLIAVVALSLLALFSFIPSILAYPGVHTIIDTVIIVGMVLYAIIGIIIHKIYNLQKRRIIL